MSFDEEHNELVHEETLDESDLPNEQLKKGLHAKVSGKRKTRTKKIKSVGIPNKFNLPNFNIMGSKKTKIKTGKYGFKPINLDLNIDLGLDI